MGLPEIVSRVGFLMAVRSPRVTACLARSKPQEVAVEDSITFQRVGEHMMLASAPEVFTDIPFTRISSRVRGGGNDDGR